MADHETNSARQMSQRIVMSGLITLFGFVTWKLLVQQKNAKKCVTMKISDIYIHPIKSCKGTRLLSAILTPNGLKYDREWMIYRGDTKIMSSQRELPCIALIKPQLSFDSKFQSDPNSIDDKNECNGIYLTAPDMDELFVANAQETDENKVTQVKIWEHFVTGYDQGDEASEWLSKYINNYRLSLYKKNSENNGDKVFKEKEYRLLKLPNNNPNRTSLKYIPKFLGGKMKNCKMVEQSKTTEEIEEKEKEKTFVKTRANYSDGFPLLMVTRASLNEMNRRLILQNEKAITMDRFRPNIVFYGDSGSRAAGAGRSVKGDVDKLNDDELCPFYEDNVKHLTICRNNISFYLTHPCSRCSMPTIDQQTMEKNPKVSKTLHSFHTGKDMGLKRKKWQEQAFFGMHACNDSCGIVKVGDILK